jgi:demethylmenaquinone methyltransferase/2-methoxy-6-polyprenyl-1,4-benzoquinol methylase
VTLRSFLSSPDGKSRYVRRLFATIADRYDLITVLLSYGQDRRWKRQMIELASLRPGARVLDVACGTGDIALALRARGGRVTGLDITPRMVELARQRPDGGAVSWLTGDMQALPFASRTFDLVTTGYGLRNVPDLDGALTEIARVLKPGGRLLSLDFDRPDRWIVRAPFLAYLTIVGSALGLLLHRDPDTYRYIPESIRLYPGARRVAERMESRGFVRARHVRVLGGLMAIHVATRGGSGVE